MLLAALLALWLSTRGVPASRSGIVTVALLAVGTATFAGMAVPAVVERVPRIERYGLVGLGAVAAVGLAAGVVDDATAPFVVLGVVAAAELAWSRFRAESASETG